MLLLVVLLLLLLVMLLLVVMMLLLLLLVIVMAMVKGVGSYVDDPAAAAVHNDGERTGRKELEKEDKNMPRKRNERRHGRRVKAVSHRLRHPRCRHTTMNEWKAGRGQRRTENRYKPDRTKK